MNFAGQVVLITGASTGIGAELARQFARAGAHVALAARDEVKLQAVADECRAAGGEALVVPTDVTIDAQCAAMVATAVAHFGRLDILVNNAGMSMSAMFDEITDLSIFEKLMRLNFLGSVWCTAYALPHLKQSRGRVVAISSLTGLAGVPKRSAYAASKHAMAGFFDSLRYRARGQRRERHGGLSGLRLFGDQCARLRPRRHRVRRPCLQAPARRDDGNGPNAAASYLAPWRGATVIW
ncbi:SDR family oxidoreductase [Gemmatimonas sp.]|uniref:SDR family oxidoreductase n=1 Tax=Gemmatimonas sp. TaxID=1962908 RepID=UPI003DA604DB